MKRSILFGILGVTALAAVTAHGQGGIYFANFDAATATYNPIVWDPSASVYLGRSPAGGVRSTDPVTITLWYCLQGQPMQAGPTVNWNAGYETQGFYGYYTVQAVLPGWSAGQTWEFQLRAVGPSGIYGQSIVWQENANINDIGGIPPGLPGMSQNFIGFGMWIPEPSTFALSGFGLAGLWLFRRRNSRAT